MKQIKNKKNESSKNSPPKGGFSDIRIRFIVLASIVIILLMAPYFGFLFSGIVVTMFVLFFAAKRSDYEQKDALYMYNHQKSMDELYNYGYKSAYYNRKIKAYEAAALRKKENKSRFDTKKHSAEKSDKNLHIIGLKLALNR